MTLIALLLASTPTGPAPRAEIVRASVEIIAAEEIRFERDLPKQQTKSQTRQQRVRDGMPLVEFY
jgi:hypothetical protein